MQASYNGQGFMEHNKGGLYEEKKHKNKSSDEKCKAFVELQLTRGCRELDERLKKAKIDEKSAKKLFTEPGACGDPFGESL